jgi:molybdate transport system substrate-binding protein
MNSAVRRILASLVALALFSVAALPAAAAEVSVAVAANFTLPMQKLAAAFERETGHKAQLAFGSTGRFHAQIRNGAPFEILLSADDETPARLEQEGLAVKGTRFTYATGRLVLWSARPGVVTDGEALLRTGEQARLAIAEPRLSPYGAAAMQVLEKLGLADRWRPRIVQGESITHAYQFVATGNAPVGFVALSQVQADGRLEKGSGWIVPAQLHGPLRQDAVLLKRGESNPAARALLAYLRSDAARALIRASGYEN